MRYSLREKMERVRRREPEGSLADRERARRS